MFRFLRLNSVWKMVPSRTDRRRQAPRQRVSVRPMLETLEDRVVPSGGIPGPQMLVTPSATGGVNDTPALNSVAFPLAAPAPDNVTTTAANATMLYQQTSVKLSAVLADATNPTKVVNQGRVSFNVVDNTGATIVSKTVNSGVTNPNFTVTDTVTVQVPKTTAVGTYTINVPYSGGKSFVQLPAGMTPGILTINARNTKVTVTGQTVAFTPGARTITLKAIVTDATPALLGTVPVGEGTVSFSIQGTNVQANFVAVTKKGEATATVQLPAGLALGTYTITAIYADVPANFNASQGTGNLIIAPAKVKIKAAPGSASCSPSAQTIGLSATVSDEDDPSVTVNEGTVTFNVAGIGSVQGAVSNGSASASITIPGGEAAGSYAITVSYSDGIGDFTDDGDTGANLTISSGSCSASAAAAASQMASNLGSYVSNLQSQLAQSVQQVMSTLTAVLEGKEQASALIQPLLQFANLVSTIQGAAQSGSATGQQ